MMRLVFLLVLIAMCVSIYSISGEKYHSEMLGDETFLVSHGGK